MLRIAICDDVPQELQSLVSLINQYLAANALEGEVIKFPHPDKLMTAIEIERFHLYILDIVMPAVNGLEMGKEIRRFDREAQIIYATTEPQFALLAYAANPINYLIKPIDKEQLFDTLALAISKVDLSEEQVFAVKTAEGLQVIKLSDIACCEYSRHAVVFTLLGGEEVVSRTFRVNFAEYMGVILEDNRFLQCHFSFVVNMRWVERFAKDGFTLSGGKIVPISAKQYPVVRDAYMDYLMAKGGKR